MFSAMVPENKTFFCKTMATESLRTVKSYSLTSLFPTLTLPSLTSYKRGISCTKLDLAEPVPPMIPIVSPDLICKSISSSTALSALAVYLNLTLSKSIEPSFTSLIALIGETKLLFSFNTS